MNWQGQEMLQRREKPSDTEKTRHAYRKGKGGLLLFLFQSYQLERFYQEKQRKKKFEKRGGKKEFT